jgi:O-antigen ligase
MRARYVRAGLEVFVENPGLGVGMGNFGKAILIVDPSSTDANPNRVAHNLYLEFFTENGVFAGLLFLAWLAAALRSSIQYDTSNELEHASYGLGFSVAAALSTLLVSGLFLSLGKSSILWFFVGLSIAFHVMSKNRSDREYRNHLF